MMCILGHSSTTTVYLVHYVKKPPRFLQKFSVNSRREVLLCLSHHLRSLDAWWLNVKKKYFKLCHQSRESLLGVKRGHFSVSLIFCVQRVGFTLLEIRGSRGAENSHFKASFIKQYVAMDTVLVFSIYYDQIKGRESLIPDYYQIKDLKKNFYHSVKNSIPSWVICISI